MAKAKRITSDEYFNELDLLSADQAINKAIHTMGNRLNSISNATDMLAFYLEGDDRVSSKEQIDRMVEIVMNNTQDMAEILNALGMYTRTLK